MPSFDVVSKVTMHEVDNALNQTNKELGQRFDFRGVKFSIELKRAEKLILLTAPEEYKLDALWDVLQSKLVKRGVDIVALELGKPDIQLKTATQLVTVREGIETAEAKKMIKLIKDRKMKVQAAIQGDQLRVTGKKRDDLQEVIALLKENDFGMPLQFKNFRD